MNTKINIALLDLVVVQMRQTVITSIVVSLLVGIVIAPTFGLLKVSVWISIGIVIGGARIRILNEIKTRELVSKEYQSTIQKLWFFLVLAGLHWGAAALFFLDPDYPNVYVFVAITILGMVSASLSSLSAIPKLWLTFATTLFACVILRMIVLNNWPVVLMSVIFINGLWVLSKTLGKRISESITKDFENAELLEEVKLAKDLAEQSNLEKSRFMAATSHDLRQPLHAQGLLLEALKGHLTSSAQKELIVKIGNSNDALNSLFDSLLEISQLDANTVRVNLSHQPFTSLCQEVLDEFEALAQDKNLNLKLVGKDCTIFSDPVLLKRIIRNLLSNALKHTSLGSVTMLIEQTNQTASLSIVDTGIGIPESEHKAIFDEYVQLNNNERDRNKGVGLGLALVRRMCALLKHTIEVESSLGNGACFKLELPLGDPEKVITFDEQQDLSSVEGHTIFVIDNEQAILDAMQALQSQWSCTFQLFSSIDQAKSFAHNNHTCPDAIICDYRLADDMTGIDAINRLRALYKDDIPAVLISGDTDAELIDNVRREGFYMLRKPINANKLRTVVAILASDS